MDKGDAAGFPLIYYCHDSAFALTIKLYFFVHFSVNEALNCSSPIELGMQKCSWKEISKHD